MIYMVKFPWFLKILYPGGIWSIKTQKKNLYFTFDDGPNAGSTIFILNELKKYNAEATFFCIGKNVDEYPELYSKIIEENHAVGNHTYNHLNGWKTKDKIYLDNIYKATELIRSNLFRPPYGRITKFQLKQLSGLKFKLKTIFWDVLSGDFDEKLSKENCYLNVIKNAKPGSIIVFHDSDKAFEKIKYVLPKALDYFSGKGFQFKKIVINNNY